MSPKQRKDVSQLVKKYRSQFPTLERSLLRKLIRVENPALFKNNPSNLKTLDRHLGKAFQNQKQEKVEKEAVQRKSFLESFLEYFKWRKKNEDRAIIEAEIDRLVRFKETCMTEEENKEYEENLEKKLELTEKCRKIVEAKYKHD